MGAGWLRLAVHETGEQREVLEGPRLLKARRLQFLGAGCDAPARPSEREWVACTRRFSFRCGTCLDARKIPGQETAGRHQVHRCLGCTDNRKVGESLQSESRASAL